MKKLLTTLCSLVLALAGAHLNAGPLGTAFTYQGRLTDGGNPANGRYDLECAVYDDASTGIQIGSVVTNLAVAVSNGLFTVSLDFGANVFTGNARWLGMGVRSNGVAGSFTPLNPRQPLTPAPYALYAPTAGTVTNGAIQSGQLGTAGQAPAAGQVLSYNGSSLVWSNPAATSGAWALGGNNAASGNFLGTLNNLPMEVRVNNARVLRLEPTTGAPNVILGDGGNTVTAGVIAASIGGGIGHSAAGDHSTIGGGNGNSAGSNAAFVGGGSLNHANGSSSTLAGGYDNTVTGNVAFIGGGARNRANNSFSTIAGGENNTASGDYSTIAGGHANQIQTNANDSFIGGGDDNIIQTDHSLIGGGQLNQIQGGASSSAIGGGVANIIKPNAFGSFIGGGYLNTVSKTYATIPGGYKNEASGDFSFAAGYQAKALHRGAFVWADSQQALFSGSLADNSVIFRCGGGVTFTSGNPFGIDQTVSWTPGNPAWSFTSDRNSKDRLQTVDPRAILAKVSRLTISEWSYKGYPQRHIEAMAQDFHALFPLSDDDKVLNEADLHGVALAAIQGLNQKLEQVLQEKDAKIAKLEKEMAGLKSAQVQASAEWDARFHTLQKAVARVAHKSAATLAVNLQTPEAQ